MTHYFKLGEYVEVIDQQYSGVVSNIRQDESGDLIYTVELDNVTDTPDGLYYARGFELRPL